MEIIRSGAISVHLEGSLLQPFIWVMWSEAAGLCQGALVLAVCSRAGWSHQLQHKHPPAGLAPFLVAQALQITEGIGESYSRWWPCSRD